MSSTTSSKSVLLLLLSFCVSLALSATSLFGVTSSRRPTFGSAVLPLRGGGLFGGGNNKDDATTVTAADKTSSSGEKKLYPAMTQDEIEAWLEPVPVYAVTDPNGAGVVLRPENDTSVFYFFLNPQQANATLQQLQVVNENLELKVSAFSLGKIWFKLIHGGDGGEQREVLLKNPSAPEGDESMESTNNVEYRLVPDTRDLLGARMLLTMSPEDGEKLKEQGSMTQDMAQAAITKAMTESPKFNSTFNEIPVFTIAQMRLQKPAEDGSDDGEPVSFLPMYFSLQTMVGTWQQFMAQAPADIQGTEPAINLMSLHDLIDMMKRESEIDFRHVILVPAMPVASAAAAVGGGEDTLSQMGGATLGDDE